MARLGQTQPVDRPIYSTMKGKSQFICAGSVFTVDDKFEFVKRIGYGAYGVVCSAIDKQTNTEVAIKKIPKTF
jgi:mitogen-activated protein kinase 1/3